MPPKQWDLDAAVARIRRIPQPFMPSLTGPTAVRKIFRRQDDALKFARGFSEELMVFSYESTTLGLTGQRFFLTSGVESFFHYYHQMSPSARCHYEVIPTHRPCKLHLDLEFSVKNNPDHDGYLSSTVFVQAVSLALQHFYGGCLTPDNLIVLDASTSKKFSQHVIFDSDDYIFESNLEQDQLMRLISEALRRLHVHSNRASSALEFTPSTSSTLCSLCENSVHRLVSRVFSNSDFVASKVGHCFVRPRTAVAACDKFATERDEEDCEQARLASICDLGVYTRNRNFRLAGSRKLERTSGVLLPQGVDPDEESILRVWPTCVVWAKTLVTYFQGQPQRRLLSRPHPGCVCHQKTLASAYPRPESQSTFEPEHPLHTAVGEHPQQLPPALTRFLDAIVHNWLKRSIPPDRHSPYADTVPGLRRWDIRFINPRVFTVCADRLHYCERIGRAHQSNRVLLVFDLSRGCFYQKCLDPECRTSGYRSPSWPIPPDCLQCSQENGFNSQSTDGDDDALLSSCLDLVEFQEALSSEMELD